jgi:hypothetical protein
VPSDLSSVGLAPAAVAQQLTHLELQHLSFIGSNQNTSDTFHLTLRYSMALTVGQKKCKISVLF